MSDNKDVPRGLEGLRKLAGDACGDFWSILSYGSENSWYVSTDHKGNLRDELSRLADEIESERPALTDAERRVLELWPRFEDGEPVMVGDKALSNKDERFKVYRIQLTGGRWMLNDNPVLGHYKNGTSKTRVKRPAPEVLDADGVPLEVGQTVWGVEDGKEFEVVRAMCSDGLALLKCPTASGGCTYAATEPETLTHQRPVLDADGVPIHEGDTLWRITNPELGPLTVLCVHPEGPAVLTEDNDRYIVDPDKLTHVKPEPPDSWERIESDLNDLHGAPLNAVEARLLVARCKKLAGVE